MDVSQMSDKDLLNYYYYSRRDRDSLMETILHGKDTDSTRRQLIPLIDNTYDYGTEILKRMENGTPRYRTVIAGRNEVK